MSQNRAIEEADVHAMMAEMQATAQSNGRTRLDDFRDQVAAASLLDLGPEWVDYEQRVEETRRLCAVARHDAHLAHIDAIHKARVAHAAALTKADAALADALAKADVVFGEADAVALGDADKADQDARAAYELACDDRDRVIDHDAAPELVPPHTLTLPVGAFVAIDDDAPDLATPEDAAKMAAYVEGAARYVVAKVEEGT